MQANPEKARHYFQQAANQGNAEAHFNLGIFYRDGIDVDQNYQQARYHFEMAARQGHVEA
jgi:TPR repeat protein